MGDIFAKLEERYSPTKFAHEYGEGESLDAMMTSWVDSDIPTLSQFSIDAALERVHQEFTWPPHCSEFLRYARSFSMLDVPSLEDAYQLSTNRPSEEQWKTVHIVVKVAAQKTGMFELRNETRDKTWSRFRDNYNKALDAYLKGDLKYNGAPALPHAPGKRVTPEEGQAARAEFLSLKNKLKIS